MNRIRADLPSPPVHNGIFDTNPLNLIPDFGVDDQQRPGEPLASPMYLSQWADVLNSYTDEVWGDLLPVVKQVKQEQSVDHLGIQSQGSSQSLQPNPHADERHPHAKRVSKQITPSLHLLNEMTTIVCRSICSTSWSLSK